MLGDLLGYRPQQVCHLETVLAGLEVSHYCGRLRAIHQKIGLVGLAGMGGVGKSVLAAALANDEAIRRAFPDGVIWVELGQDPELTERQAQVAASLGDTITLFADPQRCRPA